MTTRVFKFGLLPPTTNAPIVLEQLRLARKYQNQLVEIERARRDEYRAVMEAHDLSAPIAARVAALVELTDAAVLKIRVAKQKARKGSSAADKEDLARLKLSLAEERRALKLTKLKVKEDPEIQRAIETSNERADEASKRARARSGLYWGTYLIIERALFAAKGEPTPPNYHRWDGTGIIGVQLQKGLPVASLFGSDPRVQIGAEAKYTTVKLRVGSEARVPVFAEWPLKMHRAIPRDARVSWVTVTRRFRGTVDKWELHVTVDLPEGHVTEAHGQGAVAVDIGWRKREGGLRVGQHLDEQGTGAEILCPEDIVTGLDKADSLRSIRDRNFDAYLPMLLEFIQVGLPGGAGEHPAWFIERTKMAHAWKAPRRLVALRSTWAENRWHGDEDGFDALVVYCKQDRHLYDWEAAQRSKTLGRRREGYKVLAARLARTYETLVIEKFDLRVFAMVPIEGSSDANVKPHRVQQKQVAASELRAALVGAFRARGGQVFEAPAAYTTRECSACSNAEPWDQEKELVHACTKCGRVWDQDENACRNLLRLHRERRGAFLVERPKINRFANKGKAKEVGAREAVQDMRDFKELRDEP